MASQTGNPDRQAERASPRETTTARSRPAPTRRGRPRLLPARLLVLLLAALLLTSLVAGGMTTSIAQAGAGEWPWRGVPVCKGKKGKRVKVKARLNSNALAYTVVGKGSRTLGFEVSSFAADGQEITSGSPSLLGSDSFSGRLQRFGDEEARWKVTAVALLRQRGKNCRSVGIRTVRTGGKSSWHRCVRKGGKRNAALGCRLKRIK